MKVFTLTKKRLIRVTMLIAVVLVFCGFSMSFGMQHYYKLDFSTGIVTATSLNVRSGPRNTVQGYCHC